MSASKLGNGRKTTTLHCRVSVEEMDAWVAEAKRVAQADAWPLAEQERPFAKWVRQCLNASVKGGSK